MSEKKEIKPEEEPQAKENVENGDNSWEYYVEGRLIKEEDFKAFTSYYTP